MAMITVTLEFGPTWCHNERAQERATVRRPGWDVLIIDIVCMIKFVYHEERFLKGSKGIHVKGTKARIFSPEREGGTSLMLTSTYNGMVRGTSALGPIGAACNGHRTAIYTL